MVSRRILTQRELAALDLEGSRFFTHQSIQNGANVIPAGIDVTEVAASWPVGSLQTHLKRGVVIAKPKSEAEHDGELPELPESWDAPAPRRRARKG